MKPRILAILVSLLGLVACRTAREGNSSFEVLPPPRPLGPVPATNSKSAIGESDIRIDYVAARARRPLSSPVYPPQALAARAGRFTAYVTLTINESGRVVEARPSLARVSLPNDYSAAFFLAIDAALEKWEFDPARYVYWQKRPNEEDRYLRADPARQTIEVRFVFKESGTVE